MDRVIIDTDIYIDWINKRKHEEVVRSIGRIKHMSAIVMMELYAGASSKEDIEDLEELEDVFKRTRRMLAPEIADYIQCGRLLSRLRKEKGYDLRKAQSLSKDILIALSARRIGATVVTKNQSDFEAIKGVRDFELEVILD